MRTADSDYELPISPSPHLNITPAKPSTAGIGELGLQRSFNLSAQAVEEALYESNPNRAFMGIDWASLGTTESRYVRREVSASDQPAPCHRARYFSPTIAQVLTERLDVDL